MINGESYRNPSKKQLRSFSLITFVGFLLVALFAYHKDSLIVAVIFLFLSILIVAAQWNQTMLQQLYYLWMGLSSILGWVSSRVILIIIFYLIFTPVTFVLKLLGKVLLDLRFPDAKESFWQKRSKTQSNLEKMF